jgi:hypothetical protein
VGVMAGFSAPRLDSSATPDPLTGSRTERWSWTLLDLNDAPIGTLDGVESAQLTYSIFNTIRSGGTMQWSSGGNNAPDWTQVRLQPVYSATLQDGSTVSWPLGVFIPAAPKASWSDTGQKRTVQLFDKLLVLDGDHFEESFALPAGTVVTDAIRTIISDAGETNVAVTDSTATLLTGMAWQADTSRLQVINDLLASINYFSLWCDGNGAYRADPYTAPSSRLVVRNFIDDEASIYSPEFDHTLDIFDAPNKIILISTSDGTSPALTSVATNEDPNSPTSFPARGRWISRTDSNVQASSQAVLDALAARRLADATQVSSVITLKHAPVPDVILNSVVTFRRVPAGLALTGVVQSMTVSTAVGALVETQIQEVQT